MARWVTKTKLVLLRLAPLAVRVLLLATVTTVSPPALSEHKLSHRSTLLLRLPPALAPLLVAAGLGMGVPRLLGLAARERVRRARALLRAVRRRRRHDITGDAVLRADRARHPKLVVRQAALDALVARRGAPRRAGGLVNI